MEKSPTINKFFYSEELVTNSGIIRRTFYQEVRDTKKHKSEDLPSITYMEPMDVDSSTEAVPDAITKDIENACPNKRLHLRLKANALETPSDFKMISPPQISTFGILLIIVTFLLLVLALLFVKTGSYYLHLNPELQFNYIKNALKEKVLSQDEAVLTIGHNLDDTLHRHAPKLLVFIGTTGVGKTLAANIIKNFYLSDHVHEIHLQDLMNVVNHKSVVDKLDPYSHNLIIIDNLRAVNLEYLTKFILRLPRDYKLLIIPIFNVHDTVDGVNYTINKDNFNLIRNKIDELDIDFELVVFRQLNENIVENWLRIRLGQKGVDSSHHGRLIKQILSENHIKNKGFKELNAKLSLITNV